MYSIPQTTKETLIWAQPFDPGVNRLNFTSDSTHIANLTERSGLIITGNPCIKLKGALVHAFFTHAAHECSQVMNPYAKIAYGRVHTFS